MAQYEKLINLSLLNQFLTKAKTIFAPKITASGILKGDGNGGVSAATAGTDYTTPAQSLALGLTGASVGDLVRVNSVDANGKPTSWKKVALNEIKCNKNLLDNWYFVGGGSQQGGQQFPINQRGQMTYSGVGYGIDRWRPVYSISLTINDEYVTLTSSEGGARITQACNKPLQDGDIVTFSALTTERLYTQTFTLSDDGSWHSAFYIGSKFIHQYRYQNGSFEFSIIRNWDGGSASVNIIAAKLEFGSEQTLAHNEGTEQNPVWVLNEIPDYGEELAKCQRYLFPIGSTNYRNNTYNSDTLFFFIPTPVTMVNNNPHLVGSMNHCQYGNTTIVSGFTDTLYWRPNGFNILSAKTGHGLTEAFLSTNNAFISTEL